MARRAIDKTDQLEAIERLRELLPEGSTVHTFVTHAARSNMSRSISCCVATIENGRPQIQKIDAWVCRALRLPFDQKHGGVKVGGCGMDMGFHIVNSLSYALHGYPDASTGHLKGTARKGYTLRHQWI